VAGSWREGSAVGCATPSPVTAAPLPAAALQEFRSLNDPAQRREIERRGDFFVVEGALAVQALVESRYPIRAVLASENRAARALELVGRRAPVYVLDQEEIVQVTGFNFHRGLLATATRLPLPGLDEVVTEATTRVAVLEGVNDHENLGALFRNARAFGVGAVLLDPTTPDPLYRRSIRVSMGHVLQVPWTRLDPWPDRLADLRDRGFTLVALTPSARAEPIGRFAADPPDRVAWLLGAEGPGLSDQVLQAADLRVRIPLAPEVDSLNVATTAAVAFHTVPARRTP
jgi:tRNA G18 (ribose-2'-O)-methylase SpoU